ncbi:MAG: SseB family protein [Lachnospiraceae bacterium]|nr:SseB family protein [Lachnospiraceae bacterium]
MGLFDSWKKKNRQETEEVFETASEEKVSKGIFENPADFVCEIKDVLPLKEQGSMIIGEVLHGELTPDSKVAYTGENGRAILNCTVEAIEQAGMRVKKAAACFMGTIGPVFAFIIKEFAPNAFQKGNYLYQQAPEDKELTELQKAYEANRLTRERKAELTVLAEKEELTAEEIASISIQDIIYVLYLNSMNAKQANVAEDEEHPLKKKEKQVYENLLECLRKQDEVYMTFDKATNFPFLNQGLVDIYTKREYAELAVMYYAEQFRQLEVRALKPMPTKESKEAPAYVLMYYLGMGRIMVDNGQSRALISRDALLPPPDYSKLQPAQRPAENQALRLHMLDFFQEARWQVNYEKRAEVLKAKEEAMLLEVSKGRFMIPMKYDGMQLKAGENQIKIKPDTQLMFAAIKNPAGESYTPIFTDMPEFGKMYPNGEWAAIVIPFEEAVRISRGKGLVINPVGENLVLNEKAIDGVRECVKKAEEAAKESNEDGEETEQ